jgi:hypothetical protein
MSVKSKYLCNEILGSYDGEDVEVSVPGSMC